MEKSLLCKNGSMGQSSHCWGKKITQQTYVLQKFTHIHTHRNKKVSEQKSLQPLLSDIKSNTDMSCSLFHMAWLKGGLIRPKSH